MPNSELNSGPTSAERTWRRIWHLTWRLVSSGMWSHIVRYKLTDVSDERFTLCLLSILSCLHWRLRQDQWTWHHTAEDNIVHEEQRHAYGLKIWRICVGFTPWISFHNDMVAGRGEGLQTWSLAGEILLLLLLLLLLLYCNWVLTRWQ
jgi:hypothetical protein